MRQKLTSVALTYSKGVHGSGIEECGASGILIDDYWILTHGSVLQAKGTIDPELENFFENLKPSELKKVPQGLGRESNRLRLRIYRRDLGNLENFHDKCDSRLLEDTGTVMVAWKCPLLEKAFKKIFSSWKFDGKSDRSLLMPIFLLVFVGKVSFESGKMENWGEEILSRVGEILNIFLADWQSNHPARTPLRRGANLEIVSTPFGNPVFIDSISRGVVSNLFGDDECVMLTDANAVPGSEGAPVYVTDGGGSYICGMVIAPLSWCRGEWVDYTFAASLLPCLRRLLLPRTVNQQFVEEPATRIAESLDRSLVLVRCGDNWGTGIVFDQRSGIVITCSHVVQKAPESQIKVVLRRGDDPQSSTSTSSWAKLVYRTADGEPYDVAVLSLDSREIEPMLRSIKIADDGPVLRGEIVGSAGFPFLSSRFPTITRGNVSGVTECMLRTTCCVQSGSSGGPIVRWSTGEMLGMVVCNAIDTNQTKLYPRLNMAVPISILGPPISEYLRTGDVKALEVLGASDPGVQRTWNFYRLPSSKL